MKRTNSPALSEDIPAAVRGFAPTECASNLQRPVEEDPACRNRGACHGHPMAELPLHIQVHHGLYRLKLYVHGMEFREDLVEEGRRPLPPTCISRIQAMPKTPRNQGLTPVASFHR